jgi:hypothetical protein
LLTERQVFEDEVLPGTESADHEEMAEPHDHGKNLIGTVRIELFAKSFTLRVYDVLARHNSNMKHPMPITRMTPAQSRRPIRASAGL